MVWFVGLHERGPRDVWGPFSLGKHKTTQRSNAMPISRKLLKITRIGKRNVLENNSDMEINPDILAAILEEKIEESFNSRERGYRGYFNINVTRLSILQDGEERMENCDRCGKISVRLINGVCDRCSE